MKCAVCGTGRVILKRMKNQEPVCKECFLRCFEDEVYEAIVQSNLFKKKEIVAIGASGGKDSTCLIHVLHTINQRYQMELDLRLVAVDEGIAGYRNHSLNCVEENAKIYGLPLTIISFKELFGYTMDEINAVVGEKKSKCTHCGVFRRKALDIGCEKIGAEIIALGHNADDIAETVLMNLFRGDVGRLERTCEIRSGSDITPDLLTKLQEEMKSHPAMVEYVDQRQYPFGLTPKVKPFKYAYQREIVLYVHYLQLKYFSVECTYAPVSFRGYARQFLLKSQAIDSSIIMNIVHSGERMKLMPQFANRAGDKSIMKLCTRCGFVSSQHLCQSCLLLDQLIRDDPAHPQNIDCIARSAHVLSNPLPDIEDTGG
ncbi:putative Cytoplasmic tRNA 2-thiolation protein 1 [Blattamonas nauphoetae]|uniref:Cytoplasmic tRNA 2-thiolation protein 1 n=1 Tax=Blattamonas nauphoetae TaxID=2049346 RepID=A0ABQ9XLH2_9EUKA|nr:putative Cytoplasmic tRNA 2-thiolation protein 1 [Blattamonas nauphoetae]